MLGPERVVFACAVAEDPGGDDVVVAEVAHVVGDYVSPPGEDVWWEGFADRGAGLANVVVVAVASAIAVVVVALVCAVSAEAPDSGAGSGGTELRC